MSSPTELGEDLLEFGREDFEGVRAPGDLSDAHFLLMGDFALSKLLLCEELDNFVAGTEHFKFFMCKKEVEELLNVLRMLLTEFIEVLIFHMHVMLQQYRIYRKAVFLK